MISTKILINSYCLKHYWQQPIFILTDRSLLQTKTIICAAITNRCSERSCHSPYTSISLRRRVALPILRNHFPRTVFVHYTFMCRIVSLNRTVFVFAFISRRRDDTGTRSGSLWMTRTHISNTIDAHGLATQRARASSTITLTQFYCSTTASAP